MGKKLHNNDDDPEEKTRAALARKVLTILAILAVGILLLVAMAKKVGLTSDGVRLSFFVFGSVGGLAGVAFGWYFRGRK
ncbi:MAG TPA: hypothetical protein VG323_19325 [Thermoanaerobaculia bacterium]|nr:hypothetical protein [Thermoanaerobaculia bacterium]